MYWKSTEFIAENIWKIYRKYTENSENIRNHFQYIFSIFSVYFRYIFGIFSVYFQYIFRYIFGIFSVYIYIYIYFLFFFQCTELYIFQYLLHMFSQWIQYFSVHLHMEKCIVREDSVLTFSVSVPCCYTKKETKWPQKWLQSPSKITTSIYISLFFLVPFQSIFYKKNFIWLITIILLILKIIWLMMVAVIICIGSIAWQ
jgi:hypothetical protein